MLAGTGKCFNYSPSFVVMSYVCVPDSVVEDKRFHVLYHLSHSSPRAVSLCDSCLARDAVFIIPMFTIYVHRRVYSFIVLRGGQILSEERANLAAKLNF